MLLPDIVRVCEVSSTILNWNYSLSLGLGLGVIKFNSDSIVSIKADGSAGPVTAKFQKRFSLSSSPGRASLFISPVIAAYDKVNGHFTCELIDSMASICKRVIHLQVLGKPKRFAVF